MYGPTLCFSLQMGRRGSKTASGTPQAKVVNEAHTSQPKGQAPAPAITAAKEADRQATSRPSGVLALIKGLFSLSTIATLMAGLWVYKAGVNMYYVTHPMASLPPLMPDEATVDNLWHEGRTFDLICYISHKETNHNTSEPWVWRQSGLSYGWGKDGKPVELESKLLLIPPGDEDADTVPGHGGGAAADDQQDDEQRAAILQRLKGEEADQGSTKRTTPQWFKDFNVTQMPSEFWSAVRAGRDVYLHIYATRSDVGDAMHDARRGGHDGWPALHGVVPLIKPQAYKPPPPKRNLLSRSPAPQAPEVIVGEEGEGLFWKPEVAVRLVADWTRYPLRDEVLPFVQHQYEVVDTMRGRRTQQMNGRYKYLPPLHADEIGLTSDKYVGINSTVDALPLTISYTPMSLARWQLVQVLDNSLRSQTSMGFDEKDIDDVRRLITDTNIWLLAITLLASVLHLLFEFLAFKSDIAFWRKNKSLRGLSVRSVVIELVCQVIIFMYLVDSKASLLVLGPSAFGLLVQAWKVQRATGLTLVRDKITGRYRIVGTRLEELRGASLAPAKVGGGTGDGNGGVSTASGSGSGEGGKGVASTSLSSGDAGREAGTAGEGRNGGEEGTQDKKAKKKGRRRAHSASSPAGSTGTTATDNGHGESSSAAVPSEGDGDGDDDESQPLLTVAQGSTVVAPSQQAIADSTQTPTPTSATSIPSSTPTVTKTTAAPSSLSSTDRETLDLDRVAIVHLSIVLFPLCIGFALRSLMVEEYTGWYSWALSTLTGWVYSFGFILMTPQLFINYKLKSVAHLPWRFLGFRFVNTFIDDLFAFVIRMPTMHRVSCFRDDVVFLIYLYQRWIYPVDQTRQMDAEDCQN